jgi:hypothetical protein
MNAEITLCTPAIISAGWKQNLPLLWTGYGLTDATREMFDRREAERQASEAVANGR